MTLQGLLCEDTAFVCNMLSVHMWFRELTIAWDHDTQVGNLYWKL